MGPYDDSDEVNHDPSSLLGEEDEEGFDEMAEWPEETGLDDGFDDGEGDEDEEDDDGDEGDGDEDE